MNFHSTCQILQWNSLTLKKKKKEFGLFVCWNKLPHWCHVKLFSKPTQLSCPACEVPDQQLNRSVLHGYVMPWQQ